MAENSSNQKENETLTSEQAVELLVESERLTDAAEKHVRALRRHADVLDTQAAVARALRSVR
jgi:hypothetical protein